MISMSQSGENGSRTDDGSNLLPYPDSRPHSTIAPPPSVVVSEVPNNSTNDMNFFKVLSDNLKYVFNSPVPTTTQFPTPYSSNQLDPQQQQDYRKNNFNDNNNNINNNSVLMNYNSNNGNSAYSNNISNNSFHRNPDSSFIDRTLNPQLYINSNKYTSNNEAINDMVLPNTNTNNSNNNSNNNNLRVRSNNHNNNNNNIQSDFLLTSPEHLKEFLYDSPNGLTLFHNTPAKSPLRFVTDLGQNQTESSSNLLHLFNSVNSHPTNNNNNEMFEQSSNHNNINNNSSNANNNATNMARTPLRKIDVNLMFNNQLSNSISPSKKLSMSLTPYGRRILNDMGTPYSKQLNLNLNSNSALIDFQRAKMDTASVSTVSPGFRSPEYTKLKNNGQQPIVLTPLRKSRTLANNQIPNLQKNRATKNFNKNGNSNNEKENIDENDNQYCGSSPTTVQLNSSVTKSLPRLDPANKIPILTRNVSLIDDTKMDLRTSLTLSPTPKGNSSSSGFIMNHDKFPGLLPVPELPKMGSFRSETNMSQTDSVLSSITTSASKLPSFNNAKNSKNSTNSINGNSSRSFSTSTSTLNLQTNNLTITSNSASSTSLNNIKKVKKAKVKKPAKSKEPKFQVFVSSIHKFNDPGSSIPLNQLKHGHHNDHVLSGETKPKRKKKQKNGK